MTSRTKRILLEIACILTILGSIAIIAIPKSDDLKRRETAESVLADLEIMRDAIFAFYSDSAYFPAESPTGPIPAGLSVYLPRSFNVQRAYGSISYKNWPTAPGAATLVDSATGSPILVPSRSRVSDNGETVVAPNVIGAVIVASDPKIVGTAAAQSPRTPRFVIGNRYTFLFFGT